MLYILFYKNYNAKRQIWISKTIVPKAGLILSGGSIETFPKANCSIPWQPGDIALFFKNAFSKKEEAARPSPSSTKVANLWYVEVRDLITSGNNISKQLDNFQRTTNKTEAFISLEVGNTKLTRENSEHRTVTKPSGGELTPSTQKSCIAWRPQQLKWTEYATLRSRSHLYFLVFLLFLARSGCTMQLWLWKTTTSFLLVDNSDTTATRGGKLWKVRMET